MIALDLFAGGGGAGEGYARAGFRVIGIDVIDHEASYSVVGEFRQMKWEDGLAEFGERADLIHASPPCQHYSQMSKARPGLADAYPDYIAEVREALQATGKPYVIENVRGAPLRDAAMLCCWSFGYATYRHRYFETSHLVRPKKHLPHPVPGSRAGHPQDGHFISVAGHCTPVALARQVMDIHWMPRRELVEAIPPYMTEYIGKEMIRAAGIHD